MTQFYAIPTLLGQAAIAAAVEGVTPLDINALVVGDGGGNTVTPVETQTALVGLKATIPVQVVQRNPSDPTDVIVKGDIDQNTGGWTIRELGVLNSDGQLLFVSSYPATVKGTLATGVDHIQTVGMRIKISAAATIVLTPLEGTWATPESVAAALELWRTHVGQPLRPYWIAVDAIASTPPSAPTAGATYVVATGAAGVWEGRDNQIAQYRGNVGWSFAPAPIGTTVSALQDGQIKYYQRRGSGWRTVAATIAEHRDGTAPDLFATPAGVSEMLTRKFPPNKRGVLLNDGAGVFSWVPALDIAGLTPKAGVSSLDRFAVYDPALGENRSVTAAALINSIGLSDYLHSEIYYHGGN